MRVRHKRSKRGRGRGRERRKEKKETQPEKRRKKREEKDPTSQDHELPILAALFLTRQLRVRKKEEALLWLRCWLSVYHTHTHTHTHAWLGWWLSGYSKDVNLVGTVADRIEQKTYTHSYIHKTYTHLYIHTPGLDVMVPASI